MFKRSAMELLRAAPRPVVCPAIANGRWAKELSVCGEARYFSPPYLPARCVSDRATSSITALGARSSMVSRAV